MGWSLPSPRTRFSPHCRKAIATLASCSRAARRPRPWSRGSARRTPDCASSSMAEQRVVIVVAGFGGLGCARQVDGTTVQVLLLDRHNLHLFTPLLSQVHPGLL